MHWCCRVGGGLGAYEARVIKALVKKPTGEDKKNGYNDRPLFEIVAGASIGSANATILVCHVLDRPAKSKKRTELQENTTTC